MVSGGLCLLLLADDGDSLHVLITISVREDDPGSELISYLGEERRGEGREEEREERLEEEGGGRVGGEGR